MSFAGHAWDMIARVKQNRAPIEMRRKNRRAEIRRLYTGSIQARREETKKTEITAEELEAIKQNIRTKIRRERRRNTLVTILLLPVAALIAWGIVWCLGRMFTEIIRAR